MGDNIHVHSARRPNSVPVRQAMLKQVALADFSAKERNCALSFYRKGISAGDFREVGTENNHLNGLLDDEAHMIQQAELQREF